MKELNLCLHAGAASVSRQDLSLVPVPEATDTWYPIAHTTFIDQIEKALAAAHFEIVQQVHAMTREGNRYFGMMQIDCGRENDEFSYVLGLRNSMDKSFPAALVAGSGVFVCDNLAFSGEIKIARKHTRFIERDLPILTGRAIGMLADKWTTMENRIVRYKEHELSDVQANDFIVRSLDVGACTVQQIPAIVNEWRNPRHPEFGNRNAWRLFNAFTEIGKDSSINVLPRRTMALHGLMDAQVGLGAAALTAGIEDAEAVVNN